MLHKNVFRLRSHKIKLEQFLELSQKTCEMPENPYLGESV